jgi:hypothetical protein
MIKNNKKEINIKIKDSHQKENKTSIMIMMLKNK